MDNLLTKEEDFVFQGAGKPKVGPKKPISLVILTTKLESKKNTLAPTVKKMMEGAIEFTEAGKPSYVTPQEASAYEQELKRKGVKYTKRNV